MFKRAAIAVAGAVLLAASVLAQPAPPPLTPPPLPPESQAAPPPKAEAYAPSPPPAPDAGIPDSDEPQVTIIRRETQTIEEVRVAGVLRYIRVTPRFGLPYYLIPSGNGQQFIRRDSLDQALSPPMWLLFSW